MRTTKTLALAMTAAGAALLASRGDVAAGGAIDVTDATITIGDAPVRGTTTIEESASLGIKPILTPPDWGVWWYDVEGAWWTTGEPNKYPHQGLGGTTFHAQVDLTYPAGTYDYGTFTVDQGVTIRFTGPATLRVTNSMRIDGRIELVGAGVLYVDCAGDVEIVGHDDDVATGLFADDDGGSIVLSVGGAFAVSADDGANAHFSATGASVNGGPAGSVVVVVDHFDLSATTSTTTSISDAVFDAAPAGAIDVFVRNGYLALTDCATHGPVAKFESAAELWEDGMETRDGLLVSGGAYAGAVFKSKWTLRITDGAAVSGANRASLLSLGGSVRIEGGASIVVDQTIGVSCGGLAIGDGCEVRTTGAVPSDRPMMLIAYRQNEGAGIVIDEGAVVEDLSSPRLFMFSPTGIVVGGTVRAAGSSVELRSVFGDVTLADGADLDAPNGTIKLIAAGAVTAVGGTATLTAKEYDVRCVTGDLDLDVAAMDATAGRIVAMSNGPVRLRGTYRASGDVQVISLADAIDVHGATLSTLDATISPSGFVRMATYAATSIDASASTLTTGASQAQSGDVLIQTDESGVAVASATMRVARVTARRTPDGVMTRIQGTIAARALRTTEFSGSARITAGELSKRLYLQGLTGRIEGTSGTVSVKLTRVGKTQVRFMIEIREPTARAGEKHALRLSRAGFHAKGAFRRPKAR